MKLESFFKMLKNPFPWNILPLHFLQTIATVDDMPIKILTSVNPVGLAQDICCLGSEISTESNLGKSQKTNTIEECVVVA